MPEVDASTTNIATGNATVGEQRGSRNIATGNATVGRQIGRVGKTRKGR